MKSFTFIIAFALSIGSGCAQDSLAPNDSLSYALGQDLGSYLKRLEFPINKQQLLQAIEDALDDEQPLFESGEKDQIIRKGMQRLQNEKNAELKTASEDFMEQNRSKSDVKVTPEGVQYEILQSGSGESAKLTDTVLVHYIGRLATGETFDNSYERGDPLSLDLESVIEGWKIGIPLMNVGSRYRFFIPYQLGYGERGSGSIPPFSALVFEVELIDIKKKEENAI